MFFKVSVFACLLAVALSAPAEEVSIVSQNNDIQPDGTFVWSFEQSDGTKVEQSGAPKEVEKEVAEVVEGSVVFTDPDNNKHELSYVANENGYQPSGADLPTPPPSPPAVVKLLEYLEKHPQAEEA